MGNRKEALTRVGKQIVLHHLLSNPVEYLEYLRNQGLLHEVFPEVEALINLDQYGPYHTEDAYNHTLNVLRNLPENASKELILAAFFHDIGKPMTRVYDECKGTYHFYDHEKKSVMIAECIFQKYGWTDRDLEREKVIWLIKNHMRVQLIYGESVRHDKKIEKMFFKGIPEDYRNDLLALAKADILGSVPCDSEITRAKLEKHALLLEMIEKMEDVYARREEERDIPLFWQQYHESCSNLAMSEDK